MALAVIYRPENIKVRSSYYFFYPIPRAGKPKTGTRDEVELGKLELKRGLNFVEESVWGAVAGHPQNKMKLEEMNRKQALSVYAPDADSPVGATSDYKDLSVVQDILENCADPDWIKISLARDTRREVFQMGGARINQIQEELGDRIRQSRTMEATY